MLSDNASVRLTCVIWDGFELGWKQAPLERSLLDASADMAVVGWLPAEARQTRDTETVLKYLVVQIETIFPPGAGKFSLASQHGLGGSNPYLQRTPAIRINNVQKQDGHLVHVGSHIPQRQNCQD